MNIEEHIKEEKRRRRVGWLLLFLMANSVACQWYFVWKLVTQGAK